MIVIADTRSIHIASSLPSILVSSVIAESDFRSRSYTLLHSGWADGKASRRTLLRCRASGSEIEITADPLHCTRGLVDTLGDGQARMSTFWRLFNAKYVKEIIVTVLEIWADIDMNYLDCGERVGNRGHDRFTKLIHNTKRSAQEPGFDELSLSREMVVFWTVIHVNIRDFSYSILITFVL